MKDAKSTQKPHSEGYGTNTPHDSQNIVNQGKAGHKAPKLGAIGEVPDKNSPDQCKGCA